MKVFLTGTAGFIGFHVAEALLKRGDEVIGVDNLNDYCDIRLKQARLDRLGGWPDIAASTRDFDFLPKTSIAEGIPKFVEWYREYHGV